MSPIYFIANHWPKSFWQTSLSSLINVPGSQDSHLSKLISERTVENAVLFITTELPAFAACLPLDCFCLASRLFYFHPNNPQTHWGYTYLCEESFQTSLQVQEEEKEATFIRLFSQLKNFNSFKRESMNLTNSLQAFSKIGSKFREIEKPRGLL